MSEVKNAIREKIREYEAYKKDPNHQTEMEQNAVMVTLRELRYLDQISDYDLPDDCVAGFPEVKYCHWRFSGSAKCQHCK